MQREKKKIAYYFKKLRDGGVLVNKVRFSPHCLELGIATFIVDEHGHVSCFVGEHVYGCQKTFSTWLPIEVIERAVKILTQGASDGWRSTMVYSNGRFYGPF